MKMKNVKTIVAAGGKVVCKKKEAVIGAVVKYKNKNSILTVYHLIRVANCDLGDYVKLDGFRGWVAEILFDHDLAVIESEVPTSNLEYSRIDNPQIGSAHALNGDKKIPCNIMTVGRTFHYLSFAPKSIPLPGDSGSPIIQERKIVGILSSIFYSNATGFAISLEPFENAEDEEK